MNKTKQHSRFLARLLYAAVLVFVTACAAPRDAAERDAWAGQGADVGSTVVALSTGDFVEANPLGASLLLIKPLLILLADAQPEPDRTGALHGIAAGGWGAFAYNVCFYLAGPAGSAGCAVGGLVVGFWRLFNPAEDAK